MTQDDEAGTVEGRLADVIETDDATIWFGRYRLSKDDRAVVVAALRAAAIAKEINKHLAVS